MSKITLAPNASGTGTLTVAAPNTNSDYTLTLPAETGTVLTSASDITASQLPAGSVIQVVGANNTLNVTSLTSTSFITLGMTASITPTSASSKIYIMATFSGTQDNGSNDQSYIAIYRNSTNLKSVDCLAMYDHPGGNVGFSFPISHYDSPNTTSATSYTIYARVSNSASQFRPIANTDTIVLMEIAG